MFVFKVLYNLKLSVLQISFCKKTDQVPKMKAFGYILKINDDNSNMQQLILNLLASFHFVHLHLTSQQTLY